jgi:hypothetical protein
VIEVKMSIDNDCDLGRSDSSNGVQRLIERSNPVNAIHRAMFVRPLLTNPGIDENPFTGAFDEQTIHVHAYAILIIRRADSRPKIARHDAEHRAPIEAEFTVRNDFNSIIAEKHWVKDLGCSV